jgi:SAM-dependent methyltransferase
VTENAPQPADRWGDGDAYEAYVGRWSRRIAQDFIAWLGLPAGLSWLDVGCGTGALTETILSIADPSAVKGIDASPPYLAVASKRITDPRARFETGAAQHLPERPSTYDVAVSGLVLNFVPQPEEAAKEMARVVRPRGSVAAYVWDYAEKMELMRYFWDAAVALDATAAELDEWDRFKICTARGLAACFASAGIKGIETRAIDTDTVFGDFDDFWAPFLGGQGPAPGYVATLSSDRQEALRERLRASLPVDSDGSIRLIARAWAVRGTA